MNRYGVRRLVCVSSSAVEPHPGLGGFFFRKVLQPFFIGVVGRTLYADQKRMETLVRNSSLDWTIVRPSGLFGTPAVTDYQAAERYIDGRFTSRADLADFTLKQLTDDQYLHKAVAVATRSGTPNFYAFLWSRAPAKSRFVSICPIASPRDRRYATALVQASSQMPTTGRFEHSAQTATLPGPCPLERGDQQQAQLLKAHPAAGQPADATRQLESLT